MTISRSTIVAMVTCALALGSASIASAKAVCIQSSGAVDMIFPKFKRPKPGSSAALSGHTTQGSLIAGTVFLNTAGTGTNVYVTVSNPGINGSIVYGWTGDATLAGNGFIEDTGDNINDGARSFAVVDCSTLTVP